MKQKFTLILQLDYVNPLSNNRALILYSIIIEYIFLETVSDQYLIYHPQFLHMLIYVPFNVQRLLKKKYPNAEVVSETEIKCESCNELVKRNKLCGIFNFKRKLSS